MAFVNCCVFLTDRIRRRMSRRLGMSGRPTSLSFELFLCFFQRRRELTLNIVVECFLLANPCQKARLAGVEESIEGLLKGSTLGNLQFIQKTVSAGVDDRHLLLDGQRYVLILFQNFRETLASRKLGLRALVQV